MYRWLKWFSKPLNDVYMYYSLIADTDIAKMWPINWFPVIGPIIGASHVVNGHGFTFGCDFIYTHTYVDSHW